MSVVVGQGYCGEHRFEHCEEIPQHDQAGGPGTEGRLVPIDEDPSDEARVGKHNDCVDDPGSPVQVVEKVLTSLRELLFKADTLRWQVLFYVKVH